MLKKLTFTLFTLVSILMCASLTVADMVTDGLVAYWSLDANTISGTDVKDLVGGNNGIITGNLVQVTGKAKGALEFDGASSIDVVGTDALNFNGKSEMTVAVWIKPASNEPVGSAAVASPTACCGSIVAQRDALSWALRYDGRNAGSELEFIVCPNWQGDAGFGIPKVAAGEWHYITAVVAVDKRQLYLDGALVIEDVYAGPMASNGPETDIGKAADGAFVGTIDEIAMYNKALTAAQVMQNFQSAGLVVSSVSLQDKLATAWGQIKSK
jgi:hypothetical protein